MRVMIETPADWLHRAVEGAGEAFANPARSVVIEVGLLVPAPLDGPEFVRAVVSDAPGEVQVLEASVVSSTCGWSYDRIECVVRGADGAPIEFRVVAIYQFLAKVAVVRAGARDVDTLRGEREAIDRALASARPDWHDARVASIAELWAEPAVRAE